MTTPYGSNPTATYTNFIGEAWSQKINNGLNSTCAMLQCVNRDWQAEADKGIKSIHIISPTAVTAANYTGSIESYSSLTSADTELLLNQNVYFGLEVPDIDAAQTNTSIMDAITTQASKSVEKAIDQYLFSMHANTSSANLIGSTLSPTEISTDTIYSKFVELSKKLKLSGALDGKTKGWVVVHPDIEELLLLCSQFVSASNTGDKTIAEGAIGKIAGLDVFVSNNVGKNVGSYTVLAGTKQGITYASQLEKVETIRSESAFSSIIRGLYVFGALALEPKALATMVCSIATEEA
jgi:N4-gp56 family major capsid protein